MSAYLLEARGLSKRFGGLVVTDNMAAVFFAPRGLAGLVSVQW